MTRNTLKIHPADNVAVALEPLKKGEQYQGVTLLEDIPQGHKFAIGGIPAGASVIKYGHPIGHASEDIPVGAFVHSHNCVTDLSGSLSYVYEPIASELVRKKPMSFMGYRRSDGRVGIRNEIWILPMVGCVNDTCKVLEKEAAGMAKEYGLDGIRHFPHPYGCSQLGKDHENTKKILCDLVCHPNAGGVLLVALGCENNTLSEFLPLIPEVYRDKIRTLSCQETEDEIGEGLILCRELCRAAGMAMRTECDTSAIVVGLKCGGSDGLSGITANPAVGRFSDCLIGMGGTAILTEIPEMFGAEKELLNRCATRKLFEKASDMINDFKEYFLRNGQPVGENPSPGNKKGGITTLEDKSSGCVQKGGTAAVTGVLLYGERAKETGLSILCAPGNDLVSSTALAAAGAQIILFTTGRGTPFSAPVPTVKISTNTALYEKKKNWIDINAGKIIEGGSIGETAAEIMDYVLKAAGGLHTKSEQNEQYGIAIWKDGVTL